MDDDMRELCGGGLIILVGRGFRKRLEKPTSQGHEPSHKAQGNKYKHPRAAQGVEIFTLGLLSRSECPLDHVLHRQALISDLVVEMYCEGSCRQDLS